MNRKLWIRFLLLYLAVVFLAVCVASLYSHVRLRSHFVALLEEDLYRTARTLSVVLEPRGDEAALDALCRELKEPSGYRVTLIDREGAVLGDSDRDASSMENHLYRPEVRSALDRGFGSAIRFSHTLNYPMLYCAVRAGSGASSYFLRLSVPLEGVFAELSTIRSNILQGSLLAFLATAPVLFLLSRRMSRRIERVTTFVQAARKGDFRRRLYVGSRDELGVLEKELGEVAEQMNERIRELGTDRKRLLTLLEAIQDGILLVDAQERILFMNPYAREIVRGRGESVVGRRLMEVMRSDELHGLVRLAREGAQPPEPREVFFARDPERPFLARAMYVRETAQGASGACLVLLRDITERKRLEKVRADFLSRVSHELRTPLTLIKGFVETLQDEGFQDAPQAQRYLKVVEENTDRLVRLVGDLVRLSSIELGRLPLRVQAVSLKELVCKAVLAFEVRAREKGLLLTLDIPDGLPAVLADPDRVTEILFNLLDNAIKFTPQGRIRVSATARPPGAEQGEEGGPPAGPAKHRDGRPQFLHVPQGAGGPAGTVVLEVEDTGFGIPAGELPRVTERFFQGERKGQDREQGSGLGLAIVKHLVKVMGGRLAIRSREGRGTAVEVILPAVLDEDG